VTTGDGVPNRDSGEGRRTNVLRLSEVLSKLGTVHTRRTVAGVVIGHFDPPSNDSSARLKQQTSGDESVPMVTRDGAIRA
jgi:hypothetical protein